MHGSHQSISGQKVSISRGGHSSHCPVEGVAVFVCSQVHGGGPSPRIGLTGPGWAAQNKPDAGNKVCAESDQCNELEHPQQKSPIGSYTNTTK